MAIDLGGYASFLQGTLDGETIDVAFPARTMRGGTFFWARDTQQLFFLARWAPNYAEWYVIETPDGGSAPTARAVVAGDGLTGGGTLNVDRTLAVVAGPDGSISVTVAGVTVGVLASDVQHGLRGGGALHAVATGAAAGFLSAADKTKLDGLPSVAASTGTQVLAGAGLVGGGTLAADRTFAVGAPADGSLVVNATDVQVGVLATDAQHGVRGGGALHAAATGLAAGFMTAADATKLAGFAAAGAYFLRDGSAALTGSLDAGGQRLRNVATPTQAGDAVPRSYVDAGMSGISAQAVAVAASTTDLVLSGEQTIDGFPTLASVVLVKDQVAPVQNGLYTTAAGAWARAAPLTAGARCAGTFVFVSGGDTQAGNGYRCSTAPPADVVGTDPLTFTQLSSAGQVVAGAGLARTGSTLDVVAGAGLAVGAESVAVDPAYAFTWTSPQTFAGASPIVSAKIGPTPARQHVLPDVASDTIALLAAPQTLAAKTLTGVPHLNLVVGPEPGYAEGRVFYDVANHTLAFYNDIPSVTLNVGLESWMRVYNATGATIANGAAVYVNGSDVASSLPTVALARANTETTARVAGVATHDIATGSSGIVTTSGVVHELNTTGYNAGDPLYLSAAVAGVLTPTRPVEPNLTVEVGRVTRVDVALGDLLVQIGPPRYGAITAGALAFGGAAGLLAQDTAGLVYDAAADRLAVGLTAPLAALHGRATDAAGTAVTDVAILDHALSAPGAAGGGTGVLLRAHDALGQIEHQARLASRWQVATSGAETSEFAVQLRVGGAALADALVVEPTRLSPRGAALQLDQIATPAAPAATRALVYARVVAGVDQVVAKAANGTETVLATGTSVVPPTRHYGPGTWSHDNIKVNLANFALGISPDISKSTNDPTVLRSFPPPTRAGSVVGVSVRLTGVAVGAAYVARVFVNGTGTSALASVTAGLAAIYATFAPGAAPYAAGDTITVRVSTAAGWSGTSLDSVVAVEYQE